MGSGSLLYLEIKDTMITITSNKMIIDGRYLFLLPFSVDSLFIAIF